MKTPVLVCLATLVAGLTPINAAENRPTAPKAPVVDLSQNSFLARWLLLGPLPNPELLAPLPNGVTRQGFETDYLGALGGEEGAKFDETTTLSVEGQDYAAIAVKADREGYVDLSAATARRGDLAARGGSGQTSAIAYAFCYLQSDRDQTAYFHFGSDDGAKVWVNGQLVHRLWTLQRGCDVWDDAFEAPLRKGLNAVLVKIDDRGGGWGFSMLAFDEETNKAKLAERFLQDFPNWKLQPDNPTGYLLTTGRLPAIRWKDQTRIRELVGDIPLKIRWFNQQLEQVTSAAAPGRYAAIVDAMAPNGAVVRHALTFLCLPSIDPREFRGLKLHLAFPGPPLDATAWRQHQRPIDSFISDAMPDWLLSEPQGAVLLAAMVQLRPLDREATMANSPATLDADFQLAVKRRLLGVEDKYPPLAAPRKKDTTSPVLRDGTPVEAGLAEDLPAKLHEICAAWYDASRLPFVALVARHGVIVYHEGFGELNGEKVTLDSRFNMASITKTLTAQMFAQFVDQGLIGLDEPVGKYLPGLPTEGDKVQTFRGCYEFLTGLDGHGLWGGLGNMWLETAIATQLPHIEPGIKTYYSGMGHDLAARAMEVVSGKSFVRLMQENYYGPLGITDASMSDAAYGTWMSTLSLAKASQVILNRGSYGDLEFYSPQTFEQLLPGPTEKYFPTVKDIRGVGLYQQAPAVVGGGAAASSTVQRIDLGNDLLICIGRVLQGEDYDKYCNALVAAVARALPKPQHTATSDESKKRK